MVDGIYKVALVGQGTGSGVVIVRGSKFSGGDGYFYYSGAVEEWVGAIKATFKVARHTPGQASVFGHDSINITLTGLSGERDFFLEAPGKAFTITGNYLEEV